MQVRKTLPSEHLDAPRHMTSTGRTRARRGPCVTRRGVVEAGNVGNVKRCPSNVYGIHKHDNHNRGETDGPNLDRLADWGGSNGSVSFSQAVTAAPIGSDLIWNRIPGAAQVRG